MQDRSGAAGPLVGGRYRLGALLGEGGMGSVWRATDEVLGREVAVKRVRLEGLPAREAVVARERILREARIAASLHHRHIVAIFDVVDEDGGPWLVLEYVPAPSLAEVLHETGPMEPAVVATIGAQIARALAEAHTRGIVHRDVKPANVLLLAHDDGARTSTDVITVKVTDWGVSRMGVGSDLTGTGFVVGTPAYFAPELAWGNAADARSDVYALGATLHELLDGAPPFGRGGADVLGLLLRISRDDVPAPRRGGPLAGAVAALTRPDPARRPTATAVAATLGQWSTDAVTAGAPHPAATVFGPTVVPPVPSAGRPVSAARPARPPGGRRLPRRWVVAGLAAAVVLVATAIAAGLAARGEPPASRPRPVLGKIVLGDVRTADPCSLVDLEPLERIGRSRIIPAFLGFSSCVVEIAPIPPETRTRNVIISLQLPQGPREVLSGQPEQLGEVTLVRYDPTEEACSRRLVLSDRYRIYVASARFPDDPPALCAIADAAVEGVIARLAAAGIGRRPSPDDGSALARTDACDLIGPAELGIVPGLGGAVANRGFGGWLCSWGNPDDVGRNALLIQYGLQFPLGARDGSAADLGGRPGRVRINGGACLAQFAQRSFEADGRQMSEVVQVFVFGPQIAADSCGQVTAIAVAVAARLPPPS